MWWATERAGIHVSQWLVGFFSRFFRLLLATENILRQAWKPAGLHFYLGIGHSDSSVNGKVEYAKVRHEMLNF
jgi:hypothetical protein